MPLEELRGNVHDFRAPGGAHQEGGEDKLDPAPVLLSTPAEAVSLS